MEYISSPYTGLHYTLKKKPWKNIYYGIWSSLMQANTGVPGIDWVRQFLSQSQTDTPLKGNAPAHPIRAQELHSCLRRGREAS